MKRAFTIIELLTSLAVVSILMSMLLPALHRGREEARAVLCGNNLYQLGVFMQTYQAENNGDWPRFFYHWEPGQSESGVILIHYQPKWASNEGWLLFDPAVMVCPSDLEPNIINVKDPDGNVVTRQISYDVNVDFLIRDQDFFEIKYLSELAIMWDGDLGGIAKQGAYMGTDDYVNFEGTFAERHPIQTGHTLFCDGHVARMQRLERWMVTDENAPTIGKPGSGGGGGPKPK